MTASDRSLVRVAFVVHVMQVAGAEMLVASIIDRLGNAIAPTIVCLDAVGPLGERLRARGVEVVDLGRRPGLDVSVAWRLSRVLSERRIEVVHAHQYTPFFYSALAKPLVGRRTHLMFTEHGRHYPDLVSARRRLVNAWVLARMADEVNAVCAFSARSLATLDGFGAAQIEVIENGIDIPQATAEDLAVARDRLGLAIDRHYIACVARFHPVKDHATLIEAFAVVAAHRPDTDLLLAGDGPLRGALEQQVRSLGLDSRVRFLGVRHDVPVLLRAVDAFALTSVSEAASLTVLEAMAAARPVVVTEVGGNPEMVRAGIDGLLVPRGDAAATATALLTLLGDEALSRRMGAAARQRVEDRYQLDRTVEQYGERYRRAASRLRT
jgi:glycosyltransferase involved in cell wall biosynthesis